MEPTTRAVRRPRHPGLGLVLAGVALAAAACTGNALAAGDASAPTTPPSAQPSPTPRPTPSPTPQSTPPSAAVLAQHASAYIVKVQGYAQNDDNGVLPQHVCTATFSEFEFIAPLQTRYASDASLTDFVSAASAIGWACELRRVAQIRSGVESLSALAPTLAALGG